jgi:hypothetical protein
MKQEAINTLKRMYEEALNRSEGDINKSIETFIEDIVNRVFNE